MINIGIEYKRLFFKFRATGKVPTDWEELTEHQFIALSRIVNGADPDYRFLSVLTGISEKLLKKLPLFSLLQLSEEIDFLSKVGNKHSSFIIKEIKFLGGDLAAPKPKLDSLTFGQYIFADAYYNDWMTTKSEKALNNLIATLYLVAGHIFTSDGIPDRASALSDVALDIRKAIALNYGLVISWVQQCYPLIFLQPGDNAPGKIIPEQQSGWLKLFESMVADDLINRDRYAELPIHTVLRHLTRKYKENARR
jgi:hypothetical protein